MARTAEQLRKSELAQIHIAKGQLGMDDGTYRDMLWTVGRVRSASDLDWAGRKRVMDHLKACGARIGRGTKHKPKRPTPDRAELMAKIEAQLADMQLPWNYAHAMARHMFKVEKLDWCAPEQLHKIVAALAYKQKKLKKEGNGR